MFLIKVVNNIYSWYFHSKAYTSGPLMNLQYYFFVFGFTNWFFYTQEILLNNS